MNLLLTGATGFVGQRLAKRIQQSPELVLTCAIRREIEAEALPGHLVQVAGLDANTDWTSALHAQQVVVHTAARVHIMKDEVADPLVAYRQVNVAGTLNLARQAAAAGVQRFIFISSIKVNGEQTYVNQPFTAQDTLAPEDAYAQSKYEAELALQQLAVTTGMQVVIIRSPLVYGPGVKGNFANMLKLLATGLPLPLGATNNKRSMVALDNLVDLIITCIDHPAAVNQVFLVSDGEDLSTTELLRRLAKVMGKPARLLPVPPGALSLAAVILRKPSLAQRLLGSLQVDTTKTQQLLGWKPPLSVDEGLKRCFESAQTSAAPSSSENRLLRVLDLLFATLGLVFGAPILLLITLIGLFDTGSPIFRQQRVGRYQKPFILVKFRTMALDTQSVASHLADSSAITRFGRFLRRTKLDELPQLWNVLRGEMSLVGPRPGLFNQQELIQQREKRGIYEVRPGITGLAQVNAIDMSTPVLLAETDQKMIQQLSITEYFRYIVMTLSGKGRGDRVNNKDA